MRFYWIAKQANHIEVRKTYVATQGATFFFILPTGWKFTQTHLELKANKRYSRMNVYSFQWLWLTFTRRTFKKRVRK